MKKCMVLLLVFVLGSLSVDAQTKVSAQAKSNAEKKRQAEMKRINALIKEFQKNPLALKRMLDKNKESIDSIEAKVSRKQATIDELTNTIVYYQNKVTSLETQIKESQKRATDECPPCGTLGMIPTKGIAYKIELGTFNNPDISDNFTAAKGFGIEKVDYKYEYMLSYFENYEECMKFVNELKKLGITGAIAVKYEDGKRAIYDATSDVYIPPSTTKAAKPVTPINKPASRPATKPVSKSNVKSTPKAVPAKKAPATKPPVVSTKDKP